MSAIARAHRRDDDLRHADSGVALAHERRGAGLDGRGGEGVAVEREPGNAKEKRAVGDVTRVVGETRDLGGRGRRAPYALETPWTSSLSFIARGF